MFVKSTSGLCLKEKSKKKAPITGVPLKPLKPLENGESVPFLAQEHKQRAEDEVHGLIESINQQVAEMQETADSADCELGTSELGTSELGVISLFFLENKEIQRFHEKSGWKCGARRTHIQSFSRGGAFVLENCLALWLI